MTDKKIREILALAAHVTAHGYQEALVDRLSELTGIEEPLKLSRFEEAVIFAHRDGEIIESRRLTENELTDTAAAFEEFEIAHPDAGVEVFGKVWDWVRRKGIDVGGLECMHTKRRPKDAAVMQLAAQAMESDIPVAPRPR